jgi:hypothetical protein
LGANDAQGFLRSVACWRLQYQQHWFPLEIQGGFPREKPGLFGSLREAEI